MKVVINDREFTVLEGKESTNKFGMLTIINSVYSSFLRVRESDPQGDAVSSDVHSGYVSDEYIIDRLHQFGFEIEFCDCKAINTIQEFSSFLFSNKLKYNGDTFSSESSNLLPVDFIEHAYKVELNILK